MPFTYKNRYGDTYYLTEKMSKKGTPRYYFTKKDVGRTMDNIPDGYEVYENANAQVFLRRILISKITSGELELCENRLHVVSRVHKKVLIVDRKKSEIIIHFGGLNIEKDLKKRPEEVMSLTGKEDFGSLFFRFASYTPMLKFKLVDEEKRLFITELFCFLGGINDWFEIGKEDSLENQIQTFGSHLGKDSFYDLI